MQIWNLRVKIPTWTELSVEGWGYLIIFWVTATPACAGSAISFMVLVGMKGFDRTHSNAPRGRHMTQRLAHPPRLRMTIKSIIEWNLINTMTNLSSNSTWNLVFHIRFELNRVSFLVRVRLEMKIELLELVQLNSIFSYSILIFVFELDFDLRFFFINN